MAARCADGVLRGHVYVWTIKGRKGNGTRIRIMCHRGLTGCNERSGMEGMMHRNWGRRLGNLMQMILMHF